MGKGDETCVSSLPSSSAILLQATRIASHLAVSMTRYVEGYGDAAFWSEPSDAT